MIIDRTYMHVTLTFCECQTAYLAVSYSANGYVYFSSDMKGNTSMDDLIWRD